MFKMFEVFIYYINFGGLAFFHLFFVLLIYYFIFYFSFRNVFLNKPFWQCGQFIKRFAQMLIILIPIFLFNGFVLEKIIAHAKASRVIFFSNLFLQFDKLLFNTYVPFWFQSTDNSLKNFFDILAPLIVGSYDSLALLLGLIFLSFLLPTYVISIRRFFVLLS